MTPARSRSELLGACTLTALVILAGCGGGDTTGGEPADLAITGVTVVDPVDGATAERTVMVNAGRIVSVGPGGETPEAEVVIDGTGKYLMPGLWDFHVHLAYDDAFTAPMPELFLRWGITSIRDTGGPLDLVLPAVEAIESAAGPRPRVFFAGPLLDGTAAVYDGVSRPELGVANASPEAARRRVAELDSVGASFVKVYEMVSPEIFAAIVEEASARGLPIDGHVPLSMRAREAGPQVQSLEHLRNLEMDCVADPEGWLAERRTRLARLGEGPAADLRSELHALQRLPAVADYDEASCDGMIAAMSSTVQVPTLRLNALSVEAPFERVGWDRAVAGIPEPRRTEWATWAAGAAGGDDPTFGEWSLFLTGRMHDAGVPFAAGTDTPIGFAIPGWSLHSELQLLVRAGLTPQEALHSATVVPARWFGLEGEMGRIAAGHAADLVLLGANPLDDISNTTSIELVLSAGQVAWRR